MISIVASSNAAHADDDAAELRWRYDFGIDAVLPVAFQSYENVSSFGARLAGHATRGLLATQVDVTQFATETGLTDERITYRVRGLAGWRHYRSFDYRRAMEFRALAGVELAGFDEMSSNTWRAEAYRPGFALELAIENRSKLDWGVVSLHGGVALSSQPFGDEDEGEANYLGLEIIAGFSLSF